MSCLGFRKYELLFSPFSRAFQQSGTSEESEFDKLGRDLARKLKLLMFTLEKPSDIVSKANVVAITGMIEEIKLKILEMKFVNEAKMSNDRSK